MAMDLGFAAPPKNSYLPLAGVSQYSPSTSFSYALEHRDGSVLFFVSHISGGYVTIVL